MIYSENENIDHQSKSYNGILKLIYPTKTLLNKEWVDFQSNSLIQVLDHYQWKFIGKSKVFEKF